MTVRAQASAEVESALERAAGQGVAWPELVSLVRRTMRSVAGPTADLEDLTQIALERMVRTLGREPRFEPRAQLSTFAYRVCAGVAKNQWRWWRRWARKFVLGTEGAREPSVDSRIGDALHGGLTQFRSWTPHRGSMWRAQRSFARRFTTATRR